MSIYRKLTARDKCCYWAPGPADRSGRKTFKDPVELGCFWLDEHSLFTDKGGNQAVSKAKVFVSADVEIGGRLWHGAMSLLLHPTDPYANPDTWEIRMFDKKPNLKVTKYIRIAIL